MPRLYIVGTPIGNLEDLTFRAKNILSEVGYIFSEDTRVTKKLLARYDIKSKLISIYQPNKNLNTSSFINILETNDVAFVTDAGTPGISDPAGEFVKLARNNNHQIISIPGVSALTSAEVFTYETTGTPGYFSFNNLTSFPVIDEDKEQPAFISGSKTFLFGLINFAVSAMKCTPAITIISAEVLDASTARASESAEKSAIPW